MIKLLTDAEMEAVSGGFRGESFRDFLVGEAGPQRLLAADDLSSSSLGGSAAPLAHIELETESRAETLMAVNFRQTLGWGGASGHVLTRTQAKPTPPINGRQGLSPRPLYGNLQGESHVT